MDDQEIPDIDDTNFDEIMDQLIQLSRPFSSTNTHSRQPPDTPSSEINQQENETSAQINNSTATRRTSSRSATNSGTLITVIARQQSNLSDLPREQVSSSSRHGNATQPDDEMAIPTVTRVTEYVPDDFPVQNPLNEIVGENFRLRLHNAAMYELLRSYQIYLTNLQNRRVSRRYRRRRPARR